MMHLKHCLTLILGLLPALALAGGSSPTNTALCSINPTVSALDSAGSQLNPDVLKLALTAYNCAVLAGMDKQEILTIIDYSRPSTEQRLWVFDLQHQRVLLNSLVAHGQGSGGTMAQHFSDQAQTHASSLGLFLTGNIYEGHNGASLKLYGLENGFNDKAESRDIVVHGAPYVDTQMAAAGHVGRSWGCPAVPKAVAQPLINTIKDGTLLFSYYPDPAWLKTSRYLHCNNNSDYAITVNSFM